MRCSIHFKTERYLINIVDICVPSPFYTLLVSALLFVIHFPEKKKKSNSKGLISKFGETLRVLYTDDYNRVVLDLQPGIPDSDYVNGSYVDVRHCGDVSFRLSLYIYIHTYNVWNVINTLLFACTRRVYSNRMPMW